MFVAQIGNETWIELTQDDAINSAVDSISSESELEDVDIFKMKMNGENIEIEGIKWGEVFLQAVKELKDGNN